MAGSKTNAFENSLQLHIFQNANLANIGDATGLRSSTTTGSLYVALYTTAPSDSTAGTEANYTSYARVAVARTSGGWTVASNVTSNTSAVTFPACTGGTNTIVGFGILTANSGGDLLYWGDGLNLSVSTGITPEFAAGALQISED